MAKDLDNAKSRRQRVLFLIVLLFPHQRKMKFSQRACIRKCPKMPKRSNISVPLNQLRTGVSRTLPSTSAKMVLLDLRADRAIISSQIPAYWKSVHSILHRQRATAFGGEKGYTHGRAPLKRSPLLRRLSDLALARQPTPLLQRDETTSSIDNGSAKQMDRISKNANDSICL